MQAGVWFWIIYVIFVVLFYALQWPFKEDSHRTLGGSVIVFILIGLLGWGIFGPPIK